MLLSRATGWTMGDLLNLTGDELLQWLDAARKTSLAV
jgi:hypothetical protein